MRGKLGRPAGAAMKIAAPGSHLFDKHHAAPPVATLLRQTPRHAAGGQMVLPNLMTATLPT